jgi:hypothetical protein
MKLVQSSDAIRLSGLTSHQLREWCGRRGVVVPDVPPAGRGRLALFSWQTLLALRVLNELHQRYGVEVSAWSFAITKLQSLLKGRSFPGLWGTSVIFPTNTEACLLTDLDHYPKGSYLVVALDCHLSVLASPEDFNPETQLPLFPAVAIR